jgi:hypothetical protein
MKFGNGPIQEQHSRRGSDPPFGRHCPTLLVIGSRGIGRIARTATDLLRSQGLHVGLSLAESAFINGERVRAISASLAQLHRQLIRHDGLHALIVAASVRRAMERPLGLRTVTAASLWGDIETECRVQPVLAFAEAFQAPLIVTSGSRIEKVLTRHFARERLVIIGSAPGASAVEEHIGRGGSGLLCRWSRDGREPHSAGFYLKGTLLVRSGFPDLRFERGRGAEARLHAFALAQLALVADAQARTYH